MKKSVLIFSLIFCCILASCKSTESLNVKAIKNPSFNYENDVLYISEGKNQLVFNNVKSWNLTSEEKHYDYSVTEDNKKCVLVQTEDEVIINDVHSFNRIACFLDFEKGKMKKIDDNIGMICFNKELNQIVYVKNYDYTKNNSIAINFYDSEKDTYTEKVIDFSSYGEEVEPFPVTVLIEQNGKFYLQLWSDSVTYGKINLSEGLILEK